MGWVGARGMSFGHDEFFRRDRCQAAEENKSKKDGKIVGAEAPTAKEFVHT